MESSRPSLAATGLKRRLFRYYCALNVHSSNGGIISRDLDHYSSLVRVVSTLNSPNHSNREETRRAYSTRTRTRELLISHNLPQPEAARVRNLFYGKGLKMTDHPAVRIIRNLTEETKKGQLGRAPRRKRMDMARIEPATPGGE